MIFLDFARIIKFAWQGFFRNIWLSLVTIIIIVLSLVSVSVFLLSNIMAEHILTVVQDKTEVYIDLTKEATAEQAQFLVDQLNSLAAVKEAVFITPAEALENFKVRHQNDPLMIESLAALETNPFTGSIKLKIEQLDDFPAILNELSKEEYTKFLEVDDQEFIQSKLLVEKISEYSTKIQDTWKIISLIFIIISLLVVYNTIQINIYTQREEIGIMKLVGASNSFIRSPFLFEGMLYSLIGLIILLAIIYPALIFIQPYLDSFFQDYTLNMVETLNQQWFRFFGIQILVAVLITVVSSYLATRKYLRV